MKNYIKQLALIATVLVSVFSFAAQAQENSEEYTWIEGRITDQATDSVIFGATIKMNDVAAYSREDGSYRLRVKEAATTMTVSAPGYDTRICRMERPCHHQCVFGQL